MNRWNRCIVQTGVKLDRFLSAFLDSPERSIFLIAGGGFDPRTTSVAKRLATMKSPIKRGLFIREERPGAAIDLRRIADANTATLCNHIVNSEVQEISIFAEGNAVVGGRETAKLLARQNFSGVTD